MIDPEFMKQIGRVEVYCGYENPRGEAVCIAIEQGREKSAVRSYLTIDEMLDLQYLLNRAIEHVQKKSPRRSEG